MEFLSNPSRTSAQQNRGFFFVPRTSNLSLSEAYIEEDFDDYEDEIINEYRRYADEN